MRRSKNSVAAIAAALILLAGIGSCYYIPTGYAGTARANIGAKDVPAYMASIALVVTGPGMVPIQLVFSPAEPHIDLDVPAGPARTFTLFLTTSSATLVAEKTVDLMAGETREILLAPKLGGADIVIPDAVNNRIVQISDMMGRGWIEKGWEDIAPTHGGYAFEPWDVDFDDQGRIYIANMGGDAPPGGVIRIDDIDHASEASYINVEPNGGIITLAVDRANGYIYYTPGYGTLYRKSINSPTIETDMPEAFDLNADMPNFGTTGIAVDGQGYVYITNNMSSNVVKYNPALPAGSRIIKSGIVEYPWDVTVKNGMVLVSDPGTSSIAIFDADLNSIGNYYGPALDPFVGPKRFLGALGMSGIYMIDEQNMVSERIIFMRELSGAGWATYGSPGQFNFFEDLPS